MQETEDTEQERLRQKRTYEHGDENGIESKICILNSGTQSSPSSYSTLPQANITPYWNVGALARKTLLWSVHPTMLPEKRGASHPFGNRRVTSRNSLRFPALPTLDLDEMRGFWRCERSWAQGWSLRASLGCAGVRRSQQLEGDAWAHFC